MTKHKKPKVGDTVGWFVYDEETKCVAYECVARSGARKTASQNNVGKYLKPYRVARLVLDK